MESDNNGETSDRHSAYQSNGEFSPVKPCAWDSLEQSRYYLDSATGAIEELTRTLEAFASRKRKPTQHEFTISEVGGGGGEREVSSNRLTNFESTPRELYDVQFGTSEGDIREGGKDRSSDGETRSQGRVKEPEPFSEPAAEQKPEFFSEVAKPTKIVKRRSGGLEL